MIFPVLFTFGLANIGFAEPTPESFQVITNEDGTPLVRANGVPSEIDTAREPLVDCLCICTTHIQKFAAAVGRWFHQTFAHDFNPQSAADAEITKDTCIDGNLWSNWVEPQLYIILSLSLSMAVVVVLLTRLVFHPVQVSI